VKELLPNEAATLLFSSSRENIIRGHYGKGVAAISAVTPTFSLPARENTLGEFNSEGVAPE